MNLDYIAKNALLRAELPIDDGAHIQLAHGYVNDSIQDIWNLCDADWKTSNSSFVTVDGCDEYILNKYFDRFVKDGIRGVDVYRRVIHFIEQERFFRVTQVSPYSTGNPIIATHGDYYGIDEQLNIPSQITVYSSLANKTTGAVKTVAQSKTITGSGTAFSKNDVGLRIKISGDFKSYLVTDVDVNTQELYLEEKYEGASNDSASYELGDIDVHVNVKGYVAGAVDTEDILLNGSTPVSGVKLFTTLLSVSKSGMTGGKVTAQSSLAQIVAQLDPSEFDIERRSVKVWRIPGSVETIKYRFYMRHPILRVGTERPLLPEKWHRFILYKTEAKLRGWAGMSLTDMLTKDLTDCETKYINEAQDTSQGSVIPNLEGQANWSGEQWNAALDTDFSRPDW